MDKMKINNSLKPRVQEHFLSKFASKFYKDIISIFKEKCEDKLNDFINDLLNDEQANKLFEGFDALNANKKLIFEDAFNDYIDTLEKKEEESIKKAFNGFDELNSPNKIEETNLTVGDNASGDTHS